MDPKQIRKNVLEILEYLNTEEIKEIIISNPEQLKYKVETKFTEFNQNYPTLVKKILQGDKLYYLDRMLDAMEAIQSNKVTKLEAEKKLGEELAEEYIYPVVDKNKKK